MLDADLVDPSLKHSFARLQCQQHCHAIAMMAEVHGHVWIPYSGEDLAARIRTGRPPRDVLRPVEQRTHRGFKCLGAVTHMISDSTCKFSSVTNKRLGPGASPQSFIGDNLD
eukprot:716279-Pyramimonas_sp.AAC.1